MTKPVGVLRFLGTNCDRDLFSAAHDLGLDPRWLWHADRFNPNDFEALFVPGGFSHGDYLRSGALAAKAPAMDSVADAARRGLPILGICNGFQILCEAHLLPGALVKNEGRRFVDDWVDLHFENPNAWTPADSKRARLPIAHGDGRYYLETEELKRVRDRGQVWVSYAGDNPNGSVENIAGVCNESGNVCGLMPHPERAVHAWMGGVDGRAILDVGRHA